MSAETCMSLIGSLVPTVESGESSSQPHRLHVHLWKGW
jgi:hypothetical protein